MAPCLHDFNPRSPCGERLFRRIRARPVCVFQSTLPLRGATSLSTSLLFFLVFQSTLPLRGATIHHHLRAAIRQISIHAPLAGSDPSMALSPTRNRNFNPRSPCGERRARTHASSDGSEFQSTLPLRGATCEANGDDNNHLFQSTLPLRGATNTATPAVVNT